MEKSKKIKNYLPFAISSVFFLLLVLYSVANAGGIEIPTEAETGLPSQGIKVILGRALSWLLGIVGTIALISFVVAGIRYIASAGESKKMEAAKNQMVYSIVGVVVVLAAFIIVKTIDLAMRGTLSN